VGTFPGFCRDYPESTPLVPTTATVAAVDIDPKDRETQGNHDLQGKLAAERPRRDCYQDHEPDPVGYGDESNA